MHSILILMLFVLKLYAESNQCNAISQITNTVLMIPPNNHSIVWDEETATDNTFMRNIQVTKESLLQEWNSVVDALKQNGIIVKTAINNIAPNCLFPNNWLSTHSSNSLTIYPMKALNRRLEVREDIINSLNYKYIHDMTSHVNDNLFLEGTGALVLDRQYKIAYMSVSERASSELATQWAEKFKYELILFESVDRNMNTIYHTNIIMSVGSTYVIICLQCIKTNEMQQKVVDTIRDKSKKEIIDVTFNQVNEFCGNVLEVGMYDNRVLMMSDNAYNHFTEEQKEKLINEHGVKLVHPKVSKIEKMFGGGVRCMMTELFTTDL